MNPKLKGGWHVFYGFFLKDNKESTRFTIGRFKDDTYYILGYTPTNLRLYCSENEESSGDHGIVTLPKDRKNIADLVNGDELLVTPNEDYIKHFYIVYKRF